MIDGWALFCNALWVVGLSALLATLSLAAYRANQAGGALLGTWRQTLLTRAYRIALSIGLTLVLLGTVLSVWLA